MNNKSAMIIVFSIVVCFLFLTAVFSSNIKFPEYTPPPKQEYICPNGDWHGWKENMTLTTEDKYEYGWGYGYVYGYDPIQEQAGYHWGYGTCWHWETYKYYYCPICHTEIKI